MPKGSRYKVLNFYIQGQQINPYTNGGRDCQTVNIDVKTLATQALEQHLDLYTLIASKLFLLPYEKVTSEQRDVTKTRVYIDMYKGGLL